MTHDIAQKESRGTCFYHNPSPPLSVNVRGSGTGFWHHDSDQHWIGEMGVTFILYQVKCVKIFSMIVGQRQFTESRQSLLRHNFVWFFKSGLMNNRYSWQWNFIWTANHGRMFAKTGYSSCANLCELSRSSNVLAALDLFMIVYSSEVRVNWALTIIRGW